MPNEEEDNALTRPHQRPLQFLLERVKLGEALWSSVHLSSLPLKHFAAAGGGQYAHEVANLPSWRAQHGQAGGRVLQQDHHIAARDADRLRKPLKSLQLESTCVKLLQYLRRIPHSSLLHKCKSPASCRAPHSCILSFRASARNLLSWRLIIQQTTNTLYILYLPKSSSFNPSSHLRISSSVTLSVISVP